MKSIIVAIDRNGAIGFENDLPWGRTMRDDLVNFKRLTTGKSIIMGRNTFHSLADKPLPDRENIVVSHTPTGVKGVLTALSLESAYNLARYPVFVIGGGQLFQAAIDSVDRLYVTEIDAEFPDAKVFFPSISYEDWQEISRDHHEPDERNAYAFDFVVYERIGA